MKKIYLYGLMLCASVMGMISCSEEDHSDTRVTNFATIELEGDDFMEVNVGEPYTEPGYTAIEGTEDITSKVIVTGNVDTSKSGFYTLTYTAVNKDNFAASVERTVMVKNPNGIASAYLAETSQYSGAPITITDLGDGTYEIDDVMAGYYFFYKYLIPIVFYLFSLWQLPTVRVIHQKLNLQSPPQYILAVFDNP